MILGGDRQRLRRVFAEAWRKARAGEPLEPLEEVVAEVVRLHPEYRSALERPGGLERDFHPELGETNPFLHMAMHVALREQLGTDRPPGVRAAYGALRRRFADPHDLEHAMMECLGRCLWAAQRRGTVPDEGAYLECLREVGRGRGRGSG